MTEEALLEIFLLLPFGAGSRLGVVLLYVTVLVTTLLTLTGLLTALRGVLMKSKLPRPVHSAGENGAAEYIMDPLRDEYGVRAVTGECAEIGEY